MQKLQHNDGRDRWGWRTDEFPYVCMGKSLTVQAHMICILLGLYTYINLCYSVQNPLDEQGLYAGSASRKFQHGSMALDRRAQ